MIRTLYAAALERCGCEARLIDALLEYFKREVEPHVPDAWIALASSVWP